MRNSKDVRDDKAAVTVQSISWPNNQNILEIAKKKPKY
jgi:hypothetical protein